jgi:predicted enzyme related to lactoylglutathione lyase
MDAKVQQVAIVVNDQAAALDFYTQKVGFETKTDVTPPGGNRWVTVGPRGQELEFALFQLGSAVSPEQRPIAQHWAPGRAPPIVLRVADCKAIYEELRARGVHFLQPPVEYPWGCSATFADPDGNLFSLNQPPASRSRA